MSSWFDQSFYYEEKAKELNTIKYDGKTNWDSMAVRTVFDSVGLTAEEHYKLYGAFESGVNANRNFDDEKYYAAKTTQLNSSQYQGKTTWTTSDVSEIFKNTGLDPITHYLTYGKSEGLTIEKSSGYTENGSQSLINDNAIDSLLEDIPNWDWYKKGNNTMNFYFMQEKEQSDIVGFSVMDEAQKSGVISSLEEMTRNTGIVFQETTDKTKADLFYGNATLTSKGWAGVTYIPSGTLNQDGTVTYENMHSYVYMDNASYHTLQPGSADGYYQTLLHENGHALGLDHPFDGRVKLPTSEDNTGNTLMSYTSGANEPYDHYQNYDTMALQYIYGNDGLGGQQGYYSSLV